MLSVKVKLERAEDVKRKLISLNLINRSYLSKKEKGFIYFPILKKDKTIKELGIFTDTQLKESNRSDLTLSGLLKNKLSKEELDLVVKSYDVVGSIAILELPEELKEKEEVIAKSLLDSNHNIKTVLKRQGIHEGVFRTQKCVYVLGEKTKETIHKENGCIIKLNVETVYFSVRLSHERMRIASLVKDNETVLVMFSGCAPYPCVISKHSNPQLVLGIEINESGHNYGVENVKLNKLKNVVLIKGDVRDVLTNMGDYSLPKKFDRILMPLPKTGEEFFSLALNHILDGGIIHYYCFLKEDEIQREKDKLSNICQQNSKKCIFLDLVRCGAHAPRTYRFCIDVKVSDA